MREEGVSVISKPVFLFFRNLFFSLEPVGAVNQSEPFARNLERIEQRADGLM